MHDPLTVAHQIPNPFLRKRHNYRPALVTIWHKDPETDGTDDSCDWFGGKPSKAQLSHLRNLAQDEARDPWFTAHVGKKIENPVTAEVLAGGSYLLTARVLRVDVSLEEATYESAMLIHNSFDNCRNIFAYLSGYHGNTSDDRYWREEHAMHLFCIMARHILRHRRRVYQHPRWHIHHWQIQIHPVQHFKRWAFSRCTKCGGRFRWGYSPVGPWSGDGPQWFKAERGVHHMDCDRPASNGKKAAA